MLTRAQKDQVWDVIPTSYVVEVIGDDVNTVTFTKDDEDILEDGTGINDVQVIETFQPEEVRYPTVQIQYASADTRVNFMNFQFGDEYDHTQYQNFGTGDSWVNCKNSELILDLTQDADDITSRFGFKARVPTDPSDSSLRVQIFQNTGGAGYKLVSYKDFYWEEMGLGLTGNDMYLNYLFSPNEVYKIKFISYGDGGPNDLGVEIQVDVGGNPIHELFKQTWYEVYGSVENLIISVRVIAEDKLEYEDPGEGYYVEAQDIVDKIVKTIETAFFKDYNYNVDSSALVKVQGEYDVTDMIASGKEERLAARQVDFLVVNENRLRSTFTTPTSADIVIVADSPSDTL